MNSRVRGEGGNRYRYSSDFISIPIHTLHTYIHFAQLLFIEIIF